MNEHYTVEYVEEPHALLNEKQLKVQVGIALCIDESQLEIQVVCRNFEEIFWTLFSNKDWEIWNLPNCKFK